MHKWPVLLSQKQLNKDQMEKKEKARIRRKIATVLNKTFLTHPILEEAYGDEMPFKKKYINSVSCSITNYLLKGRCRIAPEYDYHYIEQAAEAYPEPEQKYQGQFAVDLYSQQTLDSITEILQKAFFESKDNVTEAAKTVIETITKTI